ncbi:uncharacterized protein LOC128231256 [Mya arenaria]|uniref:uncharacterized protein LOC128231256 n=1 Tax=Mya arenaria TaxID=6604 RepID=UPI0022E962D6|nr:uncharacterized protein LOC128231256 [Mya arenaria]
MAVDMENKIIWNISISHRIFIILLHGFVICGSHYIKADSVNVNMYTDLVENVGTNSSCSELNGSENAKSSTRNESHLYLPQQGILLSKYSFFLVARDSTTQENCYKHDISSYSFHNSNWTCILASAKVDWIFIDCPKQKVLASRCINYTELTYLLGRACRKQVDNGTCLDTDLLDGGQLWCSKLFHVEKIQLTTVIEKGLNIPIEDLAAYLCIAFILVAFLLAILIPDEKCRPTYRYDKEKARRVPLEIYEMYGANYKPSAKKRLTNNIWNTSAMTSHSQNVAAVANDICRPSIGVVSIASGISGTSRKVSFQDETDKPKNCLTLTLSPNGLTLANKYQRDSSGSERWEPLEERSPHTRNTIRNTRECVANIVKSPRDDTLSYESSDSNDSSYMDFPDKSIGPKTLPSNLHTLTSTDKDSSKGSSESDDNSLESSSNISEEFERSAETFMRKHVGKGHVVIYKTKVTNIFPKATKISGVAYPALFDINNETSLVGNREDKHRLKRELLSYQKNDKNHTNVPFTDSSFLQCSTLSKIKQDTHSLKNAFSLDDYLVKMEVSSSDETSSESEIHRNNKANIVLENELRKGRLRTANKNCEVHHRNSSLDVVQETNDDGPFAHVWSNCGHMNKSPSNELKSGEGSKSPKQTHAQAIRKASTC